MSEPVTSFGPSDFSAWSAAYAAARHPRIEPAEIIAALDSQWAREGMSARAVAQINGEFNMEHLRRIAALEVARDTLERLAALFDSLPAKAKRYLLEGV